MSEITKLKQQRGFIKAQLTRLKNFLTTVNPENLTDLDVSQLQTRLEKAEPLLSQFEEFQTEIEALLSQSEHENVHSILKTEQKEHSEFENDYFEIISRIKLLVSQNVALDNNNTSNNSVSVRFSPSMQLTRQSTIKLPEIKLPTFNGSYEKWLEFRDAFEAIVHNNQQLSNVEKFYYLKSYLQNEPLQVVANIQVTNDNYLSAWALLTERYENKRLIVYNYIKALFECPNLSKESHTDLRNLYDLFNKNLRSLKSLGQNTDNWDTLIVYMLVNKFDAVTRRDWESYTFSGDLPTLSDVNLFLKSKCELLEKLETSKKEVKCPNKSESRLKAHTTITENKFLCYYCKKNHSIYKCFAFKKLSSQARMGAVNKLNLCRNCFKSDHTQNCPSTFSCRFCGEKHNSLLHVNQTPESNQYSRPSSHEASSDHADRLPAITSSAPSPSLKSTSGHALGDIAATTLSVLPTANIKVFDSAGRFYSVRALLDPGSQSNFITESLAEMLDLQRISVNFEIMGVGEALSAKANSKINLTIMSNINDYSETICCLVIPKITQSLPSMSFDFSKWKIPENIRLADESFNIRGPIDMLLGVDIFYRCLLMKQIKSPCMPVLQNTRFGWIVGGYFSSLDCQDKNRIVSCHSLDSTIDERLTKFWVIEEGHMASKVYSKSEEFCEDHFIKNHSRTPEGRFVVKFPFKENLPELGFSRDIAFKRLSFLEKRLNKDVSLKYEYAAFLEEYEELGHMSKIKDFSMDSVDFKRYCYLPHHPVVKEASLTTKVRVVFDGSAKTDSGLSLNDVQFAGPTIQKDLLSILLSFRIYPFVINADISKMYRQILIDPSERCYQRILWKNLNDPKAVVECFELNTVTYGFASSPFLAVRCLKQLALEFQTTYPEACQTILNCFYLDDLLAGASSESELLKLQKEISFILSSGGFQLRKWLSNKPELLENFQVDGELSSSILQLGEGEQSKTLGIFWNSTTDTIHYSIKNFSHHTCPTTKRIILSITSQIFDPLGLLGPVVVNAKLILQLLWQEQLTWDESVPTYLADKWLEFCRDLQVLNELSIPRFVLFHECQVIHIHAFADASEKAYGGCVYITCYSGSEYVSSRLLVSKSRVAPLKKISLPRLELCAAEVTVNLVKKSTESIVLKIDRIFYWTDSLITLSWIKGCPSKWKTFVANRVTHIQNLSSPDDWFHIRSEKNPADCLSRGVSSKSLLSHNLWWNGPVEVFSNLLENTQGSPEFLADIPEQRIVAHTAINEEIPDFEFCRFSSLLRLQRIIAYCRRFIQRIRHKKHITLGPLTVLELSESLNCLLRMCQIQSFPKEYNALKNKRPLSNSSKLLCLKPFIDEAGLIRVGGRIRRAQLSMDQKHPIVLDNKHSLTNLIMTNEHIKLLHGGPQHLLYTVRQRFWPLCGRRLARSIVRRCVTCFKVNPTPTPYVMGDLPQCRVSAFEPVFSHTGLDYAGPISIRDRKTRNPKILKTYICIFVCMSTKCIHLEIVSDLTSQAFLAILKRFVARRGKPLHLYSDNGTTFVGANSILSQFLRTHANEISASLSSEGIQWHFMPPRAPNFGGLWEAGVKSFKYHLKRIVSDAGLTYENLNTDVIQIEGVLNSRPLSPLSSDPQDLTPLTPAHFLVGRPLTSIPETDVSEVAENRLSKYQRFQKIVQQFWKRWNKEYVSNLQTRIKWRKNFPNLLKLGSLVLIKEDNLPVCKWKIGRVMELHDGVDKITRVVTVRCSDGSLCKRAITKLCVLPID